MRIFTLTLLLGLAICGDRFSREQILKDEAKETAQDYANYAAEKAKEYGSKAEDVYDSAKVKAQEYTK